VAKIASASNVFVDHTFLIARFSDQINNVENIRKKQRLEEILDSFYQRPFPPRYFTTNSEVSRSITNVFRETKSTLETSSFINRLVSSNNPQIEVGILTRRMYIKAIEEYRNIHSAYFEIGLQFLGLSSVMFIIENRHYNIREAISLDDRFHKISEIIGIHVYS
jgi:hypothetical protein